MVLEIPLSSQEFLESSQSDHWSQDLFPAHCPGWLQSCSLFLQLLCFQLDVFGTLDRCLDATVLLFYHRPSRGGPYDRLESRLCLRLTALIYECRHQICCSFVRARQSMHMNVFEWMWGKTLRLLLPSTFLSCIGLMCLKSIAQLGLQSSESESTNHHLWILIMPACQHKDPLHFIHILEMLCQGLSAIYFQAHKAWMSTNVWAEQHLLALFGEGLLCWVVLGSVTSMRSIVAVVLSSIISYIIQNNGANLAHCCRLLVSFS